MRTLVGVLILMFVFGVSAESQPAMNATGSRSNASNPPPPTPTPTADQAQEQSTCERTAKENEEDVKTTITVNTKPTITVTTKSSEGNIITEYKQQTDAKKPSDWWMIWPTIGLFVVGFGQAFLFLWQLKQIKKQGGLAYETYVSTHRPKLRVRNFTIIKNERFDGLKSNDPFSDGDVITGRFHVTNVGGSVAKSIKCGCWMIMLPRLPMTRPYEGREEIVVIKQELNPGEPTHVFFSDEYKLNAEEAKVLTGNPSSGYSLYVMGWLSYEDEIGTIRTTHFCRNFNLNERRFLPVDDPDYENED